MAGSYNRVILVGNLTRDPEVKNTAGDLLVRFTLAVSRKMKDRQDEVTFVDIIAWGKLAEICRDYLEKGKQVLVEGRLVIRDYIDKDGNKRKATEVSMTEMQMLGRKGDSNGEYAPRSRSSESFPDDEGIEGEIPF